MMTMQQRAEAVLVGGVSSGWNYLIDGPLRVAQAHAAHLIDESGTRFIDYILGWGSLLLGHNPAPIRLALEHQFNKGFLHQCETPLHVELAERICALVPCAERVRLASSGTQATMSAVRVARAASGRDLVIKFEGHFHGLPDGLLFAVDSSPRLGAMDSHGQIEAVPGSSGVPDALIPLVVVLPFNHPEAFLSALRRYKGRIAAVILEPIAFNMGCVTPDPGFLELLREQTSNEGIALIFDEVLTGFRLGPGGAQEVLGITPDLVCLGKALGCGMPIAALAGRQAWMEHLSPLGSVEMSGTNNGRILTVAGTLAALDELTKPAFGEQLLALQQRLERGLEACFHDHGIAVWIRGAGGRIGIYPGISERPRDLREIAAKWDRALALKIHRAVRGRGLYGFLNPLPFSPEAISLSVAHTTRDIDETLNALDSALDDITSTTTRTTT